MRLRRLLNTLLTFKVTICQYIYKLKNTIPMGKRGRPRKVLKTKTEEPKQTTPFVIIPDKNRFQSEDIKVGDLVTIKPEYFEEIRLRIGLTLKESNITDVYPVQGIVAADISLVSFQSRLERKESQKDVVLGGIKILNGARLQLADFAVEKFGEYID